jgi:hypothetical protein
MKGTARPAEEGGFYVKFPTMEDGLRHQFKLIDDRRVDKKPIDTPEVEPMSINKIDQFRRSYGWTPPFGFTEDQLLQYMEDNPNASPEDLEAGANQIITETTPVETETETPRETMTLWNSNVVKEKFTTTELKNIADSLGMSKWYTPKGMDINRAMPTILEKIKEAESQGISEEEIINYLKEL